MSDQLVYQESTVRAFHGTDETVAELILREGFKVSVNSDNYLGSGVYFFEDQLPQAKRWAQFSNKRKGSKEKRIAVLLSKIKWGYCLNLTDSDCLQRVLEFKAEIQIKINKKISLAAAINIAVKALKADSVRAARVPKNVEFDDLRFSPDIELILSVVNLENIASGTTIHWRGDASEKL